MKEVVVASVYRTENYGLFKKLNGNRAVLDKRKALIISSIKERGWIRNPIVVNEKMEIIDGQGRYEALRELAMPVEYVIAPGTSIDDCIALNIKQANWKCVDYVKCYADMGYEDYIILSRMYEKYNLQEQFINVLAGYFESTGPSNIYSIKAGRFKIMDASKLDDRLAFAERAMGIVSRACESSGRAKNWASALKFVYYCPKIDNATFLDKLRSCSYLIRPCATIKQALECLEGAYNHRVRKENRIYFIPERDKIMCQMRDWTDATP